jgi:hypothetical protein
MGRGIRVEANCFEEELDLLSKDNENLENHMKNFFRRSNAACWREVPTGRLDKLFWDNGDLASERKRMM